MSEEIKKNEESAECNEQTKADECESTETQKPDRKEKKAQKKIEEEIAKLKEENEKLAASVEEEKDRALRIAAEYDNFRRRTRAEHDNIYADAYIDAINQMLPIIDNLERAESFGDSEEVKAGVVMILNSAREALKKMGVEEIEALGCEFDPNLHNAVMHTEDESLGENVVSAVLLKGYKKGDRIIRYAMVQVAN